MALLDRKNLLKGDVLEIKKVDLGKGEFVFVTQMTGRGRDRFEQSLLREVKNTKGVVINYKSSLEDFRAKLAVCTICDENGKLILEQDDYSVLSQKISAAKLEKIVDVAQRINKITAEDKEALTKN